MLSCHGIILDVTPETCCFLANHKKHNIKTGNYTMGEQKIQTYGSPATAFLH